MPAQRTAAPPRALLQTPIGAGAWNLVIDGPPPPSSSFDGADVAATTIEEHQISPPSSPLPGAGIDFFVKAKSELLRVDVSMADVDRYASSFDRYHGVSSDNLSAYILTGAFKTLEGGAPWDLDDLQRCLHSEHRA